MTFQLDIFGNRVHEVRRCVSRPTWQPSLVPVEAERAADVDEVQTILERFRAAGNRGDDEPPEVQS